MKGTQIAGLILVLAFVGGLIVTKASMPTAQEADASADAGHSVAAAPEAQDLGEIDLVEHYGGEPSGDQDADAEPAEPGDALPTLVELGSVGCLPCELMQPILMELKTELAGKVDVVVIDVAKDQAAARKYRVMTIPTIVWEDAQGNELDRHIGMMEKQDILNKMKAVNMLD